MFDKNKMAFYRDLKKKVDYEYSQHMKKARQDLENSPWLPDINKEAYIEQKLDDYSDNAYEIIFNTYAYDEICKQLSEREDKAIETIQVLEDVEFSPWGDHEVIYNSFLKEVY